MTRPAASSGPGSRRSATGLALLVAGALGLLALGCSAAEANEPWPIVDGCNPIAADADCLLPFPSDHFLEDDAAMPSGKRVAITEAAQLRLGNGQPADTLADYPADGFSQGTQILALFPGGVDQTNLITAGRDPAASLEPDSPTVLLEVDAAGQSRRVMHLSETDPRALEDARRAVIIRPLERLQPEQRYIVAIRALRRPDGSPLQPPEGFARLRDGRTVAGGVLDELRPRYEADIFPALEAAGISRAGLLLAWDFSTGSQAQPSRDMLAVRGDLIERLAAEPPEITVHAVSDDVDEHTFRRIEASVEVPLYVESAEPGARLHRDANGEVVAHESATVPFTVIVPQSVAAAAGNETARLLQFGHGFFGSREEVWSVVDRFANERGFVVVAADWWGMSEEDTSSVLADITSDLGSALQFTDRVHQAMANYLAVAWAATGPLASLPELQLGGASVLAPEEPLYFYGISQGGILGGTYLALSPVIERGTLGVSGANLSFIMFRSLSFSAFLVFIQAVVPDFLEQQKFGLLSQSIFDRIDPFTYAPYVSSEPLPSSPTERRVLLQVGIGDAQVPSLSAHLHARALGAQHLGPAPRSIAGLELVDSPHHGSALVEFDFGIDPLPDLQARPGSPNEVHEAVRRLEAGMEQIDRFFQPDGAIEHTCDGPCDPD